MTTRAVKARPASAALFVEPPCADTRAWPWRREGERVWGPRAEAWASAREASGRRPWRAARAPEERERRPPHAATAVRRATAVPPATTVPTLRTTTAANSPASRSSSPERDRIIEGVESHARDNGLCAPIEDAQPDPERAERDQLDRRRGRVTEPEDEPVEQRGPDERHARTNTPNMKPRKKISSTTGARMQIRIAQPIRIGVESSFLEVGHQVLVLGVPEDQREDDRRDPEDRVGAAAHLSASRQLRTGLMPSR